MTMKPNEVELAWREHEGEVKHLARRYSYFKGQQSIAELEGPRIDGRVKTKAITNWVKYVVQTHVGFLLSNDLNYMTSEGESEAGVDELARIYRLNALPSKDAQLLSDAILYGKGVEVMSYDGTEIRFSRGNPANWAVIEDEMGNIVYAIHKFIIKKGSVFAGLVVSEEREVYRVYDKDNVKIFEKKKDSTGKRILMEADSYPHEYPSIPVIVYRATNSGDSFISDALLKQCDTYDITRGASADEIAHNVDSLMLMKGVDPEPLMEKDGQGVTVWERLKQMGLYCLPADEEGNYGDAEYLSRDVNVDKFRFDLTVTRASIHIMGAVPDLDETIGGNDGTITNISGVALQLLFYSMEMQSSEFRRNFELGLRQRIEMVNAINSSLLRPLVGNYSINFNPALPRNLVELMQSMPHVAGVISQRDKLELLPNIKDIERTKREIREESAIPVPEAQTGSSN